MIRLNVPRFLLLLFVASFVVQAALPVLAQTPAPTPEGACPPPETWLQYIVQPGDSWERIATQYRVTEDALRAANDTPLGLLMVGRPVRIPCVEGPPTPTPMPPTRTPSQPPASAASAGAACMPPAGWIPYTVQRGDTLSALAAQCGVSVTAILQANGCRSGTQIFAGERLYLACRPASPPAQPAQTASAADFIVTATPTSSPTPTSPASAASFITQPGGQLSVALNAPGNRLTVAISHAVQGERLTVTVRYPDNSERTQGGILAVGGGSAQAVFYLPANLPGGRIQAWVKGNLGSAGDGSTRWSGAPPVATSTPIHTAPAQTPTPTVETTPASQAAPSDVTEPATPTQTPVEASPYATAEPKNSPTEAASIQESAATPAPVSATEVPATAAPTASVEPEAPAAETQPASPTATDSTKIPLPAETPAVSEPATATPAEPTATFPAPAGPTEAPIATFTATPSPTTPAPDKSEVGTIQDDVPTPPQEPPTTEP